MFKTKVDGNIKYGVDNTMFAIMEVLREKESVDIVVPLIEGGVASHTVHSTGEAIAFISECLDLGSRLNK